jgi:hypothetical protein
VRVPFLHIYGRELSADPRFPEDLQDFRDMRYSDRLRLVLEATGLDHGDVATEGMATATILSVRGDKAPAVRRTFEAANLYTRRFLDAHVKGDAEARRWLEATPLADGLEGVVTVEALPASPASASAAGIERLTTTRGPKAAVEALKTTRLADAKAPVLAEASLNRSATVCSPRRTRLSRPRSSRSPRRCIQRRLTHRTVSPKRSRQRAAFQRRSPPARRPSRSSGARRIPPPPFRAPCASRARSGSSDSNRGDEGLVGI